MIGIGIIGLGTVGIGTYRTLKENADLIKHRTGVDLQVVMVADIDPQRQKDALLSGDIYTSDARRIIENENIDIVVELIGGTTLAFDYIAEALRRKKWVVTANKALLAERGDEIFEIAAQENGEIGFEASVCGGIPVVRAIRDGLIGNRIQYMLGILNGTSNYILTRMTEENISFNEALSDAQRLGFAEQDPTLDVEGIDAAHKLNILIRLAFHCPIHMNDIFVSGIRKIEPMDIEFAKEFGYRIKLLAIVQENRGLVEARVEPAMIPVSHPMSNVNGVYNALYIVGDRVGPNLYYGKGAGSDPTGSSVVSDIVDMAQRMKDRSCGARIPVYSQDLKVTTGEESLIPFYIRFNAQDRPGVLSNISGVLADHNISISAVTQKGRKENGYVPIVMLTHEARVKDLKMACEKIDKMNFVKGESVHIRVEEGRGV